MYLITRNHPKTNIILKNLFLKDSKEILSREYTKKWLYFLWISKFSGSNKLLIGDDPIAFFVGSLFFFNYHKRFWCFEIYSKQIKAISLKTIFRNFIFEVFTSLSFTFSDSIVFPSKLRQKYFQDKYKNLKLKSKVIYNIPSFYNTNLKKIDIELYKELIEFREKYDLIFVYAGLINKSRPIYKIIKKLKKCSNVGIILMGIISDQSVKRKIIGIENLLFLGTKNHNIVHSIYKLSDVGILFYSNDPINSKLCAPVKIWEYKYHRLIVIGNKNYALMNEWNEHVDYFIEDHNSIDTLISKIRNNNAKEKFKGEFDLKELVQF